jgi:hypothetical protein
MCTQAKGSFATVVGIIDSPYDDSTYVKERQLRTFHGTSHFGGIADVTYADWQVVFHVNPAKVHCVHDRCVLRIDTEHSAAAPQTEQDARHAATWLLKLSQLSLCSGDDSSAGRSDRCRSQRPLPIAATAADRSRSVMLRR